MWTLGQMSPYQNVDTGSNQPLTELTTLNFSSGKGAVARDYVTAICEPIVQINMEASTSHNTVSVHGQSQGHICRS
jgi:hypothetical protein